MAQAISAPDAALSLVPGTEIAIRLLPTLLPVRRVAVLSPTYGDHAESWRASGAEVDNTADPLGHAEVADVVVLCNPNNPDGRCFDLDALSNARERLARRGGWLIVDEAYADLGPSQSLAPLAGSPGLIILRSTGKFFGLPGLRLGALLGPQELLARLDRLLGIWRISGPALAIGARAYSDIEWQESMRQQLAVARLNLDAMLEAGGLRIVGGTNLFRYVEFRDAHAIWQKLCENGIYTRRFDWSRSHLRIGLPGTPAAEARLGKTVSLKD